MSKPSKFATVLEAARRDPEPATVPAETGPGQGSLIHHPTAGPTKPPAGSAFTLATDPPALPERRPGRPRGKRSDPGFEQVTGYIPTALYSSVKVTLIEAGRKQDFSELVAELLTAWLERRQRESPKV